MMLNDRMSAYADVVADLVQLSDHHPVAGLEVRSDPIASIDHCMETKHGIRTDACFQLAWLFASRGSANDYILPDLSARSEVHLRIYAIETLQFRLPHHTSASACSCIDTYLGEIAGAPLLAKTDHRYL
jgi:hypothetical protein